MTAIQRDVSTTYFFYFKLSQSFSFQVFPEAETYVSHSNGEWNRFRGISWKVFLASAVAVPNLLGFSSHQVDLKLFVVNLGAGRIGHL
jgi:hypothetical protein